MVERSRQTHCLSREPNHPEFGYHAPNLKHTWRRLPTDAKYAKYVTRVDSAVYLHQTLRTLHLALLHSFSSYALCVGRWPAGARPDLLVICVRRCRTGRSDRRCRSMLRSRTVAR
eukprot:7377410-Prymnesium_polylepis.2